MADSRSRQHRAHVAGTAAGVAAGAASAPFGAAKLRDSFRESYPIKFRHGLAHVERVARREGMSQQQTSRVLRVASHGKPGFVPLVAATTAASLAGGARRYERHLQHKEAMAKSAFGIEHEVSKVDRRRATEVGAGGGAVVAGRSAVRSRRAGRGHLVRAGDLERDSNASFAASRGQGDVVAQRLARHVGSGPGSLPRTGGNLANTGRQHMRQQAHLQAGLTSRDASHAAASAGAKALRRSRGRLVLAAGLAGTAAVASTSRRRY